VAPEPEDSSPYLQEPAIGLFSDTAFNSEAVMNEKEQ
jgi:hypothetical protein